MKITTASPAKVHSVLSAFIIICVISGSAITATAQTCQFPQLKELKSGSEVSTYVYHFWDYVQSHLGQTFKGSNYILGAHGQVVGDFHFKNVGAYYSTAQKRPQLAIIDLDDSGIANQFGDLLKFLVFIKEDYKSDHLTADALKAYSAGLDPASGDNLVPAFVNIDGKLNGILKILSDQNDASYFDLINKKYTSKNLNKDQKSLINGKDLLALNELPKKLKEAKKDTEFISHEAILAKQVQKLGKILDRGFQINESGSSINAIRFIYLVQTLSGPKIVEMKELTCAGTVKFQPQKDQAYRFVDNQKNLQSQEFWEGSEVLTFGNHSYLQRTKVDNPIGEPLKEAKKNLKAWVMFYAYTLGRMHRPTAQSDYAMKLEEKVNDSDDLKKLTQKVNHFVAEYLKHLKASLKK